MGYDFAKLCISSQMSFNQGGLVFVLFSFELLKGGRKVLKSLVRNIILYTTLLQNIETRAGLPRMVYLKDQYHNKSYFS